MLRQPVPIPPTTTTLIYRFALSVVLSVWNAVMRVFIHCVNQGMYWRLFTNAYNVHRIADNALNVILIPSFRMEHVLDTQLAVQLQILQQHAVKYFPATNGCGPCP